MPLLLIAGFFCLTSVAQVWKTTSTADFNYYFVGSEESNIPFYDSIFRAELADLQLQVNYYVNSPIDIFICNSNFERDNLYRFEDDNSTRIGGSVKLNSNAIALVKYLPLSEIVVEFRKRTAGILIEEMMNGSTVQDNIRSANLLHLPQWVIPGLTHYLSDKWSPETDNLWRVVSDEYSLDNLNTIPLKYDHIKGASFWKYMEYKYGDNAISTVLYMSRLTRKFNSALYYSFQESSKSIFANWREYYEKAYAYDQKKPIPVDGIQLSNYTLIDLLITSSKEYYTLEKKDFGYNVYVTEHNGKKSKMFRLPAPYVPLENFVGSVQFDGTNVLLFCESPEGIGFFKIDGRSSRFYPLGLSYVRKIKSDSGKIFILNSSRAKSVVYTLTNDQLREVFHKPFYITEFGIHGNQFIYSTEGNENIIHLTDKNSFSRTTKYVLNAAAKDLELANDTILLYNSDGNGINNGKMLNLITGKEQYVTNYRSSIAYHQYTPRFFAEYINRGEFSSLFITEALRIDEFYTYDSISPSYFYSDIIDYYPVSDTTDAVTAVDSLEDFSFQTPINPAYDFRLSDYDSLLNLISKNAKKSSASTIALDKYKAVNLTTQLFNQMIVSNEVGYRELAEVSHSGILFLRLKTAYQNKFSNKQLYAQYVGIIKPGNRDVNIGMIANKRLNYKFDYLYRQRYFFVNVGVPDDEDRSRFITHMAKADINKQFTRTLSASATPLFRLDQDVALSFSDASLKKSTESKVLFETAFSVAFKDLLSSKHSLSANFNTTPYYAANASSVNVKSSLSFKYQWDVKDNVALSIKGKAANSMGKSPTFYMLGGLSTDILGEFDQGEFANYTEAGLYSFEYGIRGFDVNYRNGTSMALGSVELSLKPFDFVIKKPLVSEVFSTFKLIAFSDFATSFYGPNYYNQKNILNKTLGSSNAGTILYEVNAIKNPFIMSFGAGVSAQVYSYTIGIYNAWGMEESNILPRKLHLSFGIPL